MNTSSSATSSAPENDATINTTGEPADETASAFAALGLGPAALRAIAELGYGLPTPVQERTIPPLLAGRDVIAQAPTGTGKTAAYGLPIVERLDENDLHTQALVIAPTRELAIQVSEALHALGKHREMVTLPIYGGQPYDRQLRALARGVQVVVGTPGRLLDHLGRKTLDLSNVKMIVLDEADEMLNMGFIEDIEAILAALPAERQTALFSATIPPRIAALSQQYLRNPERISVAAREAVAPRVRQVYYEVAGPGKPEALSRILDLEEPESAIVFVRTRRDADVLAEQLNGQGYLAQAIHGEINQAQRERVLDRFRKGHTQLLVATDVAARGLDIPDVSHVINYDLPIDAESYVHRIGRTGRAGRRGEALTLVTPRERRLLRMTEQAIHRPLERLRLPTPADVAARRRASFREDVLEILDGGQLDPFLRLVEDLAGTHDPAELAAAAFKMAAQARDAGRPGRTTTWPEGPEAEQPATSAAEQEAFEPEARPQRGRGAQRGGERMPVSRGRRDRREPEGEMARLFLRVGRRDGVRPADLVGAIANEAGVPGDAIGDIDLYDTFSFVEVPEDMSDIVRAALNATTIRGRQPRVTLARPDESWPAPAGRDEAPPRDGRRPFERESRDRYGDRAPDGERKSLRVAGASRLKSPAEAKGAGRGYTARASKLDRRPPKPTRKRP